MLRRLSVYGLRLSVALGLLAVAGCSSGGNNGSSPSNTSATPKTVASLAIAGPTSMVAGTCSAFTVQTVDLSGLATTIGVAANSSVVVLPSGSGSIFVDASCTTTASSLPLNTTGAGTFYAIDNATESLNFAATLIGATNPTTGKFVVTVTGASASVLNLNLASSESTYTCVPVMVRTMDTFGNVSGSHAALSANLSLSGLSQTSFFSDPECVSVINSVSIPSGVASATVYLQSFNTGVENLTADASGFTTATASTTFLNQNAPRLVLTGPTGNSVVGTCTAIHLQSQRADGSPLPVAAGTLTATINITAGSAVTLSSDLNCANSLAAGQVSIAQGTSQTTFYINTIKAPQTVSLSAAASNFASGSLNTNWSPIAAARVAILGVPASVPAGQCVSAQASLLDSNSNAAYVTANTTVNLTASSATQTKIYASANCSGGTVSSVMIPVCQGLGICANGVTFSFQPALVASGSLTAASNQLTSYTANYNVTVASGTPYTLSLTRLTNPVVAGACTQIELDAKDSFGNFLNVSPNNLTLAATTVSTSGLATVFADANCGTISNSITIPSGSHSVVFAVIDPKVENLLVTLTGPNSLVAQTSYAVATGAPQRLAFSGVPSNFVATRCSGAFSVVEQDSFQNPTTAAANFNLTSANGVSFFSDASCLIPATSGSIASGSSASANFYFSGANMGNATLIASATSPASIVVSGTAPVNLSTPPVLHISMGCTAANPNSTSCATAQTAGQCFPVYAASLDANNQPFTSVSSNLAVALTSTSQNAKLFYSDAACSTQLVNNTFNISNGNNPAVFYVRDTVAENFSLTATPSIGGSGTLSMNVAPAAAYQLVVDSLATPSTFVTGQCVGGTNGFPVYVRDQFGNATTVAGNTPITFGTSTLNGSLLTNAAFFSDVNCTAQSWTIAANTSSTTFHIKAPSAGSLTAIPSAQYITNSVSRTFLVSQRAALSYSVAGSAIASINFGAIAIGTNSEQLVVMKNTSTGDTAVVSGFTLPASGYTFDSATTTCPTSGSFNLSAGQVCNLGLKFSPTTTGSIGGNVVANFVSQSDSSTPNSLTLAVVGSGVQQSLNAPQLNLANISFGNVLVGATPTQAMTLSNPNSVAVTFTGVSGFAAPFSITSASTCSQTFPFTLAANANCALTVKFAPVASGNSTGSIVFASSAGNSNTTGLSGSAIANNLNAPYLSYSSYSFGSVGVATTQTQSFTLTNPNSQSISITALSGMAAPFTVASNSTCSTSFPFSLSANATCNLVVQFAPTAAGSFTASATFVSSAGNSNTLSLSGTAVAQSLYAPWLSYSSISFGSVAVGSHLSQTMTLNNPNSTALSITGVTGVSGTFSITAGTCGTTFPFSIAASGSCTLNVVFTPVAAASYTGSVTYTSAAGNSNTTTLSGAGTVTSNVGGLALQFSAVNFQNIQRGTNSTQYILLSNNGSTTASALSLTGTAVGNSQGLTIQSISCGTSLAAGSSCYLEAIFAPNSVGAVSSSFQVTYQQNGSSFVTSSVALSGTGY